jgi:hypothetical protein
MPRKSLTNWEDALQLARGAPEKCRQANESRTNRSIPEANSLAQEGIQALTSR